MVDLTKILNRQLRCSKKRKVIESTLNTHSLQQFQVSRFRTVAFNNKVLVIFLLI